LSGEVITIMVVVAVILLVLYWGKGRNAVWGGATLGIIVGLITALITGSWRLLGLIFAIGTFVGTFADWLGRLSDWLKVR
jgi:hypothetical protein